MGTRLIGRDTELRALRDTLEATLAGRGRTVLVSGEAGIGKSRLAQELLAGAQDVNVLEGRAHPLHAGLAYAPIVEALRPHLSQDVTDLAGRGADPALAKARMFEAVTAVIQGLAPAVVYLDDLHWADTGTVELAHYVGHNTQGVLVLVTCRDPNGPLRDLAVAIRRDDPRNHVELTPLPDPAVAELATEVLGEQPPFLADLTRRAAGNPLFVTALAEAHVDARTLPTIVRDVVLSRLHGLSEPARRLVEVIAVAGESATDDLLRTVADTAQVRDLVRSGLIVEHVVGRTVAYRVAHPLYAEVAYAELTLNERRQLHAAIAEAIARDRPDDVLALAPHYLGAGELANATADVLAEAGIRALDLHAEDEALRYLTAALADAEVPELRIRVLEALGQVHQGAARLAEASEAWARAIEAAQAAGSERMGPLAYWLALLEAERGDLPTALRYVLLARQAPKPTDPDLATEYVVLGMHFALRANDDAHLRAGAEELAATGGLASHLGRSTLAIMDMDWDTAAREAALSLSSATDAGRLSHILTMVARTQSVMVATLRGELRAAVRHAEAIRDAHGLYEYSRFAAAAHYFVAQSHYLVGEITSAVAEVDKALALERDVGQPRMLSMLLVGRAWMFVELGRHADAENDIAEAERTYDQIATDISQSMMTGQARTLQAIHSGRPAVVGPDLADDQRDTIAATTWLLVAGRAAFGAGEPDRTARYAARIRKVAGDVGLPTVFADWLDALVAAPADLPGVADRLARMGAVVYAAQARIEHAELTRDPEAVESSMAVFENAGAVPWVTRSRQLAKALGIRTGALTKRESEVVRLLGEGLSNADIAARLFLSERTVESHLRNSYAKLGLTSRIALARWAMQNDV